MSFVIAGNSASTGYNLTRSLRFRASASAYLNRTFTTPTNNIKWTWSGWVKRGDISSTQCLFGAGNNSNVVYAFGGFSSNSLDFYSYDNALTFRLTTTAVYRDPSAWYHVVFICDTANATSSDRVQLWVNGSRITAFSTATYPSSSASVLFNTAAQSQTIGLVKTVLYNTYFDGYLTEVNFVDGQALTPSSFGSTNAITGVWQPAAYTGTYGTNGFYLPFTDNSALTTASNVGLGKDFSGNANYWVTNNISITAGVTYDSMTDVPTLTSATAANFCVLNPLALGLDGTLTNGNLNISYGSSATRSGTAATMGMTTGKYYWEITITASSASPSDATIGISNTTENSTVTTGIGYYPGYTAKGWGYYGATGEKVNNLTGVAYGATFTTNDVIGVAFDATAGSLTYYKNNTSQGVAFSGLPAATYYPAVGDGGGGSTVTMVANFGQRPFTYTAPTGYVALNTYNLPDSTIVKGNTVMDATLYTGNSSTQTITNAGAFKPDFVWIKNRSTASQHVLTDSVRGITKQLFSSNTNAEQTSATGITALNSNGFSLDTNVSPTGSTNSSPDSYVGWQWQAGQGSSSSNTNGTITSTVSVNASAGFSVVTWTGTGANATVGHGLGVAPQLIINKPRNAADNWISWHTTLGSTGYIYLNLTNASATAAAVWNSTLPTSSVFSVGTSSNINTSAQTMVSYCWTPIAGYSAFGSYTGNGSADGPMIYTGFRPAVIMVKRTDTTGNWCMFDDKRLGYNGTSASKELYPNLSNAEGTSNGPDQLSNGFKLRDTYADVNASGGTYIYACWAETPFKNSLAR